MDCRDRITVESGHAVYSAKRDLAEIKNQVAVGVVLLGSRRVVLITGIDQPDESAPCEADIREVETVAACGFRIGRIDSGFECSVGIDIRIRGMNAGDA